MTTPQPPKILRTKTLPTGNICLVLMPGEKKARWIWENKIPKPVVSAMDEFLSR
jgi:hypothetical protein